MIFKAECDLKAGDTIYICDRCESHTPKPFIIKEHEENVYENVYCEKCWDYQCDMGDLAADAAMEREFERKADNEKT